MTPWEVLGIAPGEEGTGTIRRAYERRLEQLRGNPDAIARVKTALDILKHDPTGADPYGLLQDPWGKWAELAAELEPAPAAESAPVPVAEPATDAESEVEAAPDPEPPPPPEPPPAPEPVSDPASRFRAAAATRDPGARLRRLREVAHALGDRMAADRSLVPLWTRLLLASGSDELARIVRRSDLVLDLVAGDASIAEALLAEAESRADFRLARFVGGALLKHRRPGSARETRLLRRGAGLLALAWPKTARALYTVLHQEGSLDEQERQRILGRVRAGEEMRSWTQQARALVAAAELTGSWDGDRTRAAGRDALGSLRKLLLVADGTSQLQNQLEQRVPALLEAAWPVPLAKRKAGPLPGIERAPRTRMRRIARGWREKVRLENNASATPRFWMLFWIVVVLVASSRACVLAPAALGVGAPDALQRLDRSSGARIANSDCGIKGLSCDATSSPPSSSSPRRSRPRSP